MGSKQTTTTSIPNAGGMEAGLLQLLNAMAKKSGGAIDFGALGDLASGKTSGPTEDDLNLVQQSIGRSGEMARRELERQMGPLMAQISERMSGRGMQGGSAELLETLTGGREMQGRLADMLAQAQNQGGEALMNLPFRRNEQKLGANQALFQMLSGAASPALANLLQSRASNTTTTTKSSANPMDIAMMAAKLGAAIPTGGASMMFPGGGMGGGAAFNYNMADFGNLPRM